jgi:hypothetical protein
MPDFNLESLSEQPLNIAINAAIERAIKPELPRSYLGASIVGEDCLRKIQYDWWIRPELPGRIKRIFERGHFFESRTREQLIEAGFKFETDANLLSFSACNGNLQGHADGLITTGPDLPNLQLVFPFLWECKCVNGKNWRAVERDGLAKVFPKYAAQISIYQLFLNQLNPALVTVANADSCELLHFAVPFTAQVAQYWSDRAMMVIESTRAGELLPRFVDNPDDWRCKMCPHRERCWK